MNVKFLSIFLFVLFYVSFGYSVCNNPVSGDWAIVGVEDCSGLDYVLNGNILISNTGQLILNNSKISINSSTDGEYMIHNEGSLILDGANITAYNSSNWYNFVSNNTATQLEMYDSYMEHIGWGYSAIWNNRGIYINTDNVVLKGNTFVNHNNMFIGLVTFEDSDSALIDNNIFYTYDTNSGSNYAWTLTFVNTHNSNITNNYFFTGGIDVSLVMLVDSDNNYIFNNDMELRNTNSRCPGTGIELVTSDNNDILSNIIDMQEGVCTGVFYDHNGILLDESVQNNVTGNTITVTYDGYGIELDSDANSNVIDNNDIIVENGASTGIYLNDASNNNFTSNDITLSNGDALSIDQVNSLNNLINSSNTANGKLIVLYDGYNNVCAAGNEYDFSGINNIYHLEFWNCNNINVTNLNLNSADGLFLYNSLSPVIKDSSFVSSNYGIYLDTATSATIFDSTFTSNKFGVYLDDSDNSVLYNLTIDQASDSGIYSNYATTGIDVSDSQVTRSLNGINIQEDTNTVDNVDLYYNTYPIRLGEVLGVTFTNSRIIDNDYDYRFYRSGRFGVNTFTNNTFINNAAGTYDFGLLYANTWDTGVYGNYWGLMNGTGYSDSCVDGDSNGICDVSYVIDASNTDNFPLSTYSAALSLPGFSTGSGSSGGSGGAFPFGSFITTFFVVLSFFIFG